MASATQLLQTDKADTHTEIKSDVITTLPLAQNRNYQSLINLVPGATPGGMQNSEVDTPGRALSTNVNGLDRNNNGTKTDGATNVNVWLPHHTMYVSPAETVDTVNVSTSNFDAEQGNAGGAAITVVTKSGTNELKGSAFAFYNNQSLNARPYFATDKNDSSAHIDGATVGGPIRKNQLFFFGGWEGQYQRTPQQFFFNVPPAALRARRLQPGLQRRRHAAGHLRPADRQRRTARAACRSPATSFRRAASARSRDRSRSCIRSPTSPAASRAATSAARRSPATISASSRASSTATTTTSRSTGTCRTRRRCGASTRAWAPT